MYTTEGEFKLVIKILFVEISLLLHSRVIGQRETGADVSATRISVDPLYPRFRKRSILKGNLTNKIVQFFIRSMSGFVALLFVEHPIDLYIYRVSQ